MHNVQVHPNHAQGVTENFVSFSLIEHVQTELSITEQSRTQSNVGIPGCLYGVASFGSGACKRERVFTCAFAASGAREGARKILASKFSWGKDSAR